MTKLINLLDLINVPGTESVVLLSKETYNNGDILIAQASDMEKWYKVICNMEEPNLKKGSMVYVLSIFNPQPIATPPTPSN